MTEINSISNNIQLPKQMVYNDGEAVVKKSSGLIKVRKGQSEDEFKKQKQSFWITGPIIQNHTYLTHYVENLFENEIEKNDFSIINIPKSERENILHALERLYFQREYNQCLKDILKIKNNIEIQNPNVDLNIKSNKNIKRVLNELDKMQEMCVNKLHIQNQSDLKKL
ncbi:hypothetical protein C6P42_001858 [Pichia californica]|nr:hypothetical protein C6P42_001858 [[Candida] californica]